MKYKTLYNALLLALISLLITLPVHAQWELENFPELKGFKAPDSLMKKSIKELNKIHYYNSAYWEIVDNPEIADAIGKVLLEQGRLKQDSLKIARGYMFLGQNTENLSLYNKALSYSESSIPNIVNFYTCASLVNYYHHNSDYNKALEYAIKARKTAYMIGDYENIFNANYLFNSLNSQWGNKEEGVLGLVTIKKEFNSEQYKKNVPMRDKSRQSFINRLNYSIALTFFEIEEYELSSKYLDTIYPTALKNNNKEYIDTYLGLKGAILFRKGEYSKALEHTNAYLYNSQPNEPDGISRSNVFWRAYFMGNGGKRRGYDFVLYCR